jgi:hypothetical protein
MADLEELPATLYYQIRLFSTTAKNVAPSSFKGLSPIFLREMNGKKIYYAAAFETYQEANKALQTVKKKGFNTAQIIAFNNNKQISVAQAKKEEAQNSSTSTPSQKSENKNVKTNAYNVIVSGFQTLPADLMSILKEVGKDIAKVSKAGAPQYIIGPFAKIKEAEAVATKLKAAIKNPTTEQVMVEAIK